MTKKRILILASLLCSVTLLGNIQAADIYRPEFNKKKDLLLAQFDSKPDPDDIHAQAALGSMMLNPDLKGIKVYAVSGAVGEQTGLFIDSRELFNAVFGKRWTAANEDWDRAVEDIVDVVLPILKKGGKVWVQEAGQSNITADWVKEISKSVERSIIKSNVIVVQHSNWNEKETHKDDLAYVQEMTSYISINDGNALPTAGRGNRGSHITPAYRAKESKWIAMAKESQNSKARKYWIIADEILDSYFPDGYQHERSYIHSDGVDYSDCCENWWIFNIGDKADSHEKFWDRYVLSK